MVFFLIVGDVTHWILTNYQILNLASLVLDIKNSISSEGRLAHPYDFGIRLTNFEANLPKTYYFLFGGVGKSV
jgi:hypothetical protein